MRCFDFFLLFRFCFILFGCVLSQEEYREKTQKGDYDVLINLVGLKFSLHFTFCVLLLVMILVTMWLELRCRNNFDEKCVD